MYIADKPSAPQDFECCGYTETSISLKWSAPADDGGSSVTGYYVERRHSAKQEWTADEETRQLTMTSRGLSEMNSYYYRVCAVNAIGRGEFNEMTDALMAKCPHSECDGCPMNELLGSGA